VPTIYSRTTKINGMIAEYERERDRQNEVEGEKIFLAKDVKNLVHL